VRALAVQLRERGFGTFAKKLTITRNPRTPRPFWTQLANRQTRPEALSEHSRDMFGMRQSSKNCRHFQFHVDVLTLLTCVATLNQTEVPSIAILVLHVCKRNWAGQGANQCRNCKPEDGECDVLSALGPVWEEWRRSSGSDDWIYIHWDRGDGLNELGFAKPPWPNCTMVDAVPAVGFLSEHVLSTFPKPLIQNKARRAASPAKPVLVVIRL
jgi:hypothetical protein